MSDRRDVQDRLFARDQGEHGHDDAVRRPEKLVKHHNNYTPTL